jgi:P2 family phage contractile tail tube protein
MASKLQTLKNFTLFIEGFGYAGAIEEIQLPTLKIKTDEHRVGGMDAPLDLDMGMEKLEASFTLTKLDPYALSMLGASPSPKWSARGSIIDDQGNERPAIAKAQGICTASEPSAFKSGEKATYKFSFTLHFYEYAVDGEEVYFIDVKNMVRRIGGIDQLAQTRANLAIDGAASTTLSNIFGR